MMIKYKSKRKTVPQLQGESHKFVLTGYTEGNTRSYAYPEGSENSKPLLIPTDTNCVIKVKGTSTVIGGTNTTFVLGTTEAFSYHTGFKNTNDGATQLSTAGGVSDFRIGESGRALSCTLYIDIHNGILRFGLDDTESNTKRIWSLSVELDINRIPYFELGYNENFALYQNADYILFENGKIMIWN